GAVAATSEHANSHGSHLPIGWSSVPYVMAIDAGTTGVRALAVDGAGAVTGWRYREFTQHYPEPGWVEHDASEIWDAIVAVVRELVADAGRPEAIGITN